MGLGEQESKQKVTKVISLVKRLKIYQVYPMLKRGSVNLSDFCYFCYFSDWRLFCRLLPSHIKVYSGRKEFAPKGANSFLLEQTPLQEGGIKILTELLPLKMYLFYLTTKTCLTYTP